MALLVFADVDGTLVHYDDVMGKLGSFSGRKDAEKGIHEFIDLQGNAHEMIKLPPSTTGMQGVLSNETLSLVHQMRGNDQKETTFVLISGARTTTMLQRLAYLPTCDAFVTENGGRIFFRNEKQRKTASPYVEDLLWLESHKDAIGSLDLAFNPPQDRQGPLWDVYRILAQRGWNLDVAGYITEFRVVATGESSEEETLRNAIQEAGDGKIRFSRNLGKYDVYPVSSGKAEAASYIRNNCSGRILRINKKYNRVVAICDDDNDVELAMDAHHVYVPCISSETLRLNIHRNPEHFTLSKRMGPFATEDMLQALVKRELP
uniref:Sucrose phosphatase-like domain-containing protein n=1 Tax=Picocystis salinarum TaxID=88271 RepID=A0A6U9S6Y9_9CHLO